MYMPIRVSAAAKAAARGSFALIFGALGVLATTAPAEANWFSSTPVKATVQAEGSFHKGPRGYHRMCVREPDLCAYDRQAAETQGATAPAPIDKARWQQVDDINSNLNWKIRPRVDQGPDYWTIGLRSGDCEDYAIAKKHALIEAGFSPDQLLYAVVGGIRTRYHLVLILRTEHGDYVLDNLTDRIKPWERSGYSFVVRQTAENPMQWARITGADTRVAQGSPSVVTQ
ncbi:MAG: transglutaminase-like cysteine peptidase [Paracoccaceae bacterium]